MDSGLKRRSNRHIVFGKMALDLLVLNKVSELTLAIQTFDLSTVTPKPPYQIYFE